MSSSNRSPRAAAGPPGAEASPAAATPLPQLLRESGQPELRAALEEFPGFSQLVELQDDVLARLTAALGVAPAQTKHTDAHGLLKLQSLRPGAAVNLFRSYRTTPAAAAAAAATAGATASAAVVPRLRTMTQIFSRYVTPDGAVRVYSKTTASPPDDWPTPQFDVEIGGTEASLIFYVALAPKASLTADLPYLNHYFCQPPPRPSWPAGAGAGVGGDAAHGSAADVAADGAWRSFQQLEAEARKQPGFSPFVSPSLWVRAAAVGAMCFTVDWQGGRDPRVMELVRGYVAQMTDLWLAHLLADAAAGGAVDTDPWVVEQWRRSGVTWRNHVRYDPLTPLLYPVYGEEQVDKWIETVSGEELPEPES